MPENFASFYRKASSVRELVGKAPFPEKARFQITKVIELPKEQYRRYRNELWRDVSFISRNGSNMRFDEKSETFLCLFVTSRDEIGGLLIEADGFDYARYAAFIPDKKALALDGIPVERANESVFVSVQPRNADFFLQGSGLRPHNISIILPLEKEPMPRRAGANAAVGGAGASIAQMYICTACWGKPQSPMPPASGSNAAAPQEGARNG